MTRPAGVTCTYAVVASRFNLPISEKLLSGALEAFEKNRIARDKITVLRVPGAFELPLTAKRLAKTGKYDAIVCLGAVIRGDTDHYQFVAQEAAHGIARVSYEFDIPVIFGVLTTENERQAEARAGGKVGNKGRDAAVAAMEMAILLKKVP